MTLRCALILATALPLAVGCQQPRAERDMQRELRFQEDRIYQLEDWIRQYNEQLGCCRNENVSLRTSKPAAAAGSTTKPPVRVSPFGDAEPKAPEVPEVEIPKVEIPKIEVPPAELPAPMPKGSSNRGTRRNSNTAGRQVRRAVPETRTATGESRRSTSRPAAQQGESTAQAASSESEVALVSYETADSVDQDVRPSAYEAAHPKQTKIARITLNPMLTAPVNRDRQPGDDGLMTVVEPRNEAGELIRPAGDLSISVIDPAATSAQEARVGRWDFDALQTSRLYRRTTLGDGIQLNLFWQERKPTHKKLDLFVRLTTPDGRKLQTHRRIEVVPPPISSPHEASHPEQLQPEPMTAEDVVAAPTPAAAVEKVAEANVPSEPRALPAADVQKLKPQHASEDKQPSKGWTPAEPMAQRNVQASKAVQSAEPTPVRPDLFQIVPTEAPPKSEPKLAAVPQLQPATAASPVPLVASRPQPPVATVVVPVTTPRALQPPRRPAVIRPPAEEQVAIPREPGSQPEASSEPTEPAVVQPRPQWAPFRK